MVDLITRTLRFWAVLIISEPIGNRLVKSIDLAKNIIAAQLTNLVTFQDLMPSNRSVRQPAGIRTPSMASFRNGLAATSAFAFFNDWRVSFFHKSLICLHPLGSDGLLWAIIAHVPPAFCFACERRSTSRTGVFFTSLHFLLLGCHVSAWHTSILIHFAPARNVRGIENVLCCFIKCAKLFVRFKPLFGLISCPPNQPRFSVEFFC